MISSQGQLRNEVMANNYLHKDNKRLETQRDDLLEALRDLADTNNDFSEALVRARLAIARATTGEKP